MRSALETEHGIWWSGDGKPETDRSDRVTIPAKSRSGGHILVTNGYIPVTGRSKSRSGAFFFETSGHNAVTNGHHRVTSGTVFEPDGFFLDTTALKTVTNAHEPVTSRSESGTGGQEF